MNRRYYMCTNCGSVDILKNVFYFWDLEKQKWVEDTAYDICSICGSEEVLERQEGDEVYLVAPIIQYGIHVINIYFPADFLKEKFNYDGTGLTLVFSKDTMELLKVFDNGSGDNISILDELVKYSKSQVAIADDDDE